MTQLIYLFIQTLTFEESGTVNVLWKTLKIKIYKQKEHVLKPFNYAFIETHSKVNRIIMPIALSNSPAEAFNLSWRGKLVQHTVQEMGTLSDILIFYYNIAT